MRRFIVPRRIAPGSQRTTFSAPYSATSKSAARLACSPSTRRMAACITGINTGLGVIAGVPDVIILWEGRTYGLELKTERGKVSEDQRTVNGGDRARRGRDVRGVRAGGGNRMAGNARHPSGADAMSRLVIQVTPCPPNPNRKWVGLFEARLGDRRLCVSRQPFLDSCRVLLAERLDPNTAMVMRYAGSDVDCLTSKLGVAARLTVDESAPRLRSWKAMPSREGSRIIGLDAGSAPVEPRATNNDPQPAPHTGEYR